MTGVGQSASERVVVGGVTLDKPSKSITLRKRFILFGKRPVVPFSEVECITLEHGTRESVFWAGQAAVPQMESFWRVCLCCRDSKPVHLYESADRQGQRELASTIAAFLAVEVRE
jgi:hypothetical protein